MDTAQHPRASGQLPTAAPGPSAPVPVGAPRAGRGVTATWWYTYSSMAGYSLFLAFYTVAFLLLYHVEATPVGPGDPTGPSGPMLAAAVLAALCGPLHAWGSWWVRHGMGQGWPRPWQTAVLLVPTGAVWVLTLWTPGGALPGAVPLWVSLNVLAILVVGRPRRALFAAGVVLIAVHWWAGVQLTGVGIPTEFAARQLPGLVFFVVFVPVVFLFSAWWWNIVVQLDIARRDAAGLAVARERLRFASDLHDIQGHHLQVIALKAELAERLLGAGREEQARQNLHEVRTLARTALEETRSLVRDLREVVLEEELANARDVLEASGATVTLRGIHVTDPTDRALLGHAVREGATNILRHASEATQVRIILEAHAGGVRLVMTNDGVAPPDDPVSPGAVTRERPGRGPASGTGLRGLDRRFAAAGGSVTGECQAGAFVLTAWLPGEDGAGSRSGFGAAERKGERA